MKRLAILLMLLAPALLGSAARVAWIEQRNVVSVKGNGGQCKNAARDQRLNRQVATRLGINFAVIPARAVQTEEARTMWMPSSPGRYEKFSGAIVPSYAFARHVENYGGTRSFRPDSLSRAARGGWQAPVLLLCDNSTLGVELGPSTYGDAANVTAAAADTSGVLGCLDCSDFKDCGYDQLNFNFSDTTLAWYATPYNAGWLRNPVKPVGGFRPLVGKQQYRGNIVAGNATEMLQPLWGPRGVDSDSVVIWERWVDPVASCPNACPVVYCDWGGVGAHSDSAGDAMLSAGRFTLQEALSYDEGAIGTMVGGFARLDHNMNHNLIQRGLNGAFVLYGAGSRGERRGLRGPAVEDSAVYYQSLQRFADASTPMLVAVEPESLTVREAQLLRANGAAKFTFCTFNGCDGATAKQVTATGHARDVFGYKRARFILGDGSGLGADTGSVVTQIRWAQARVESIFGADRFLKVIVAPDDDWSPLGANQVTIDSLFWQLDSLGYHVVVSDGQAYASNYTGVGAGTNPHGWYNRQESYPARNPLTHWPKVTKGVTVLCHTGFSMYGGVQQTVGLDSIPGTSRYDIVPEVSRVWSGLTGCEGNWDEDSWDFAGGPGDNNIQYRDIRFRTEDLFERPRKAYLVRVNASTLSGDPAAPARIGYWLISTLYASAKGINALDDGRKVLEWTWPDRIMPE